jgi:hypothetical protein
MLSFMKIGSFGVELLHADRQTDRRAGGRADGRTQGQREREAEVRAEGKVGRTKVIVFSVILRTSLKTHNFTHIIY